MLEEIGRLYTIKEVAGILCIGRDSVVRLIDNDELKCIKFPRMGGRGRNKKRMISERELRRFMERHTGKAA